MHHIFLCMDMLRWERGREGGVDRTGSMETTTRGFLFTDKLLQRPHLHRFWYNIVRFELLPIYRTLPIVFVSLFQFLIAITDASLFIPWSNQFHFKLFDFIPKYFNSSLD